MSYEAFTGLIGNAALLLSLGLIYDFVSEKTMFKGRAGFCFYGFLIGLLGLVVMMNPWKLSNEVVFDTRSILLSLTGLFFGFIPSAVAVVMTAGYRISFGGGGVYAGVATIVTSTLIGLLWRTQAKKRFSVISISELYLFGVVVHIDMLFCMLLLPYEAKKSFYSDISIPVMIIYPIASMLLGKLLSQQKERSDQKKVIQKEKEFLTVTLKSIGDAVIATDINGKVTLMNKVAEDLTGWKNDSAISIKLEEVFNIVNENTGIICDSPVEKVIKTGKIVELANHTVLISRNGKRSIIEDSAAPINDVNGKTIGVVLVFRDMTEKNKLSEKLRNTEKLESLGVLAGGIAHDFNNLLSGVYGNIELAITKSNSEEVTQYLNKAMDVFSRAKELTKQLLTFSKGGHPELKSGNVIPVIKESATFALSGSNSNCIFDLHDDLWFCLFDKNQIGNVMHNLVLNSTQAMPDGGTITLSAINLNVGEGSSLKLDPGRYVKISVKDTGTGIPKEEIQKIFDPFFTTKKGGTGLGLPTCFSVMKKHNGTIEVESVSGSGSVFSIFIPATANNLKSESASGYNGTGIDGKGKRILVMDDEYFIREVFGSMLEQLGFLVDKATDGKEAIQKIIYANEKNERYFAVFFDLTVQGGLGGEKALEKIREFDNSTTIFAASGYSEDAIIVSPEKYGFNGSIKKPFNLSELIEILKKCQKI